MIWRKTPKFHSNFRCNGFGGVRPFLHVWLYPVSPECVLLDVIEHSSVADGALDGVLDAALVAEDSHNQDGASAELSAQFT